MTEKHPVPKDNRPKGRPNDEQTDVTKPANKANPTKPGPEDNPGHETQHNPAQGSPSIRKNPDAGKQK